MNVNLAIALTDIEGNAIQNEKRASLRGFKGKVMVIQGLKFSPFLFALKCLIFDKRKGIKNEFIEKR